MVLITEELLRKRSEHNECIISTLEELSLHQQDIERIEYLDKWCRNLKILYLQSNLIPKIENVGRLKKLEYLNLALNNVEIIENLEGCESLQKLDLTVNFVGELTSIECLKGHHHFRELFLTGNPCTEYEDYREFVIATLPQLQYLDGREIEKSERILALQNLAQNRAGIIEQQNLYRKQREKQKAEERLRIAAEREGKFFEKSDGRWYTETDKIKDITDDDQPEDEPLDVKEKERLEEEKEKKFWEEKVPFTPESRLQVHEHMNELKAKDDAKEYPSPDPPKIKRRLQDDQGRIFNVNESKLDFSLKEDQENQTVILDVAIYKYLDTSLCDVDVQPTYIKVTMKEKILQLVLPEEVKPDSSTAKRSQVTGHLVITMPKAFPVEKTILKPKPKPVEVNQEEKENKKKGVERLEVDPSLNKAVDIGNIITDKDIPKVPLLDGNRLFKRNQHERPNSKQFIDDPDVPPLE